MARAGHCRPIRTVTVRDGTTVRLWPIRLEGKHQLTDLYARLSSETVYQRFFTVIARLPPDWARILANVDYDRRERRREVPSD